jgi:hypothetical protein
VKASSRVRVERTGDLRIRDLGVGETAKCYEITSHIVKPDLVAAWAFSP